MKKILALSLIIGVMASSSQAVQFRWNTTNAVQFNGASVGAGQMVDLLFLGAGGSFSYATYFSTSSYLVMQSNPTLGAPAAGRPGFQPVEIARMSADDPNPNGNVYLAIIERSFGDMVYYNASTSPYTVSGVIDDSTVLSDVMFGFNYGKTDLVATWGSLAQGAQYETLAEAQAALWGSAGGGWNSFTFTYIPVPEPATAGLAFAGLALLFRRKRK